MTYLGDFAEDYATLNFGFTTRNVQGAGSPPFALASGAMSVYAGSSTTQSTAGITLAANFDGVTGLNNVLIDLSSDAFYATGADYHVVITTGTVNSISVVGEVVAHFSIENRFMRGTDSGATAAALTTVDNEIAVIDGIVDDIILDTAGIAGSAMRGTDNAALATALTTVDNEIATIDGIVDNILIDTGTTLDGRIPAALVGGRMDASVGAMAANVLTAAAINAAAFTAAKFATDAITSTVLAASAAQKIRDEILPTQNVAMLNIEFLLVAASDHVTPVTSATGLAVTRSIDGSAFGSGTGTLAEVANGIYQYDASAADMNGGIITFRFTASGGSPGAADDKFLTIVTGGGV